MTTTTQDHCQGCDERQPDVRTFLAKFAGSETWEPVHYCQGCYELAQANWNGETEAITNVVRFLHGVTEEIRTGIITRDWRPEYNIVGVLVDGREQVTSWANVLP